MRLVSNLEGYFVSVSNYGEDLCVTSFTGPRSYDCGEVA
jgi:hypothetical protein